MKILIQFKNGEQTIGDTGALISPYPQDQIEETAEVGEDGIVLTEEEDKDIMGDKEK